MKEISAKEITEHWNDAHPNNPCTIQDVREYLTTHVFFNISPGILVKIMETDFNCKRI